MCKARTSKVAAAGVGAARRHRHGARHHITAERCHSIAGVADPTLIRPSRWVTRKDEVALFLGSWHGTPAAREMTILSK
jgi:hypothetical protein